MARFRDQLRGGQEAINARLASRGSGKFKPVHQFESGETKYLQFLESIDDVPEVLMHQFIVVGYRENGDPLYERFISRKDPNLDGTDGDDPLIDRFGLKPTARNITVAVEMEPVVEKVGTKRTITGFDVAERQYEDSEGTTVSVPNVALVIESPYTLFGHLSTMADIKPLEDVVWGIAVRGSGKDKQFTVVDTGIEALDLTEDEEIQGFVESLDDYLEELADSDRAHELLDHLPDDFPVSKWGKKGQKESKNSNKSSSRTRREKTEEPETTEDEDKASKRTRRFSDIRKDYGSSNDD